MADGWKVRVLDLLFPPKCVFCGKLTERCGICPACGKELAALRQPERRRFSDGLLCASALPYEGIVRQSILRFKFEGREQYAPVFAEMMVHTAALEFGDSFDLVTWVPVSQKRKRERGYDQAELLAKKICAHWGVVPLRALEKTVHNDAQSGMESAERRRANVLGVYEAANREQFAGKRVLLVDDILTTGCTAAEAARVLRFAGAAEVMVLTLATSVEKS